MTHLCVGGMVYIIIWQIANVNHMTLEYIRMYEGILTFMSM